MHGIFRQTGIGLPVLFSWRETAELAELCAKRYRRNGDTIKIYPIEIHRDNSHLLSGSDCPTSRIAL